MIRGVGLRSATAINVIAMVGVGPFITLPLVVSALGGSVSAYAWIAGAVIAACDGLVWAELASRFPRSGGTYAYLREAFGRDTLGRIAAFVFVWQYVVATPLLLASGYVGFTQYLGYLAPAIANDPRASHVTSAALGIVTLLALLRPIARVARTAQFLGVIALVTLLAVSVAGFAHPHAPLASAAAATFAPVGWTALGAALVITLYDFAGYQEVCTLGDEVLAPQRTLPCAVVLSVALVTAAYLLLNLGVAAALDPHAIAASKTVASTVAERAFGTTFAFAVTVIVLITAFASTYALLLGSSRVVYAAAREGDFFRAFAALHPRHAYPLAAVVLIGLLATGATFFSLDALISLLTAAGVLLAGVVQIVALFVVRRTQPEAPFRMPLYPLPALVALAGWIVLFVSSGTTAMLFGGATLVVGVVAALVRARIVRAWPFAVTAAACCVAFASVGQPAVAQAAPTWGHAQLVQRNGAPQLLVDGAPSFFWGGAFFYERMPPGRWRDAMRAMREAGMNTLDLYVPWNWHELGDGDVDFTGRTDPRRNLAEVLRLARALDFRLIVRPGPVVRNEWRNGGYPDWLLRRPEYGMPLHEVLEGRYPATATLQNAHGDAAGAEWLANPTHVRYASRWLHRVLAEFAPVADRVIAVQLDDDQGAYLDNATVPGTNLQRYLAWLEAQVRETVGPLTPVFINTYQMRRPSLAGVWTMGNWYQSDAALIGAHDRAQLDFSTLLLATNRRGPAAVSEFQAGWFAGPEDPQPRASDPSNTRLALFELLALGVHGAIDFPFNDTHAEAGWEAPFGNAAYRWDAALGEDFARRPRFAPTAAFGAVVARLGPLLASATRVSETAVAYIDAPRAANGTIEALAACARVNRTCDVVDANAPPAARGDYTTLVVPPALATLPAVRALQSRFPRARVVTEPPPGDGVTVLRAPGGEIRVAVNWDDVPHTYGTAGARFTVPPRDAVVRARLRGGATLVFDAAAEPAPSAVAADRITPPRCGVAADGAVARIDPHPGGDHPQLVVLENDRLRVEIDPAAGARAFTLVACDPELPGSAEAPNAFDATGALRDEPGTPLAPSARDFIAAFTHNYPAGTYDRPYGVELLDESGRRARVRMTYAMPDAGDVPATFERIITLAQRSTRVVVDERVLAGGAVQRFHTYASLPLLRPLDLSALTPSSGAAAAPVDGGYVFAVAWPQRGVATARWTPYRSTGTLALAFEPGWHRIVYAYAARSEPTALAEAERRWLAANPGPER